MLLVLRSLAMVLALLAVPAPAVADGMQVEPGLWEFTSSLPDPLGGDGGSQVHRTCLKDSTVTPERVMAETNVCRIWNAVVRGPSVRWKMRCDTPAGQMSGSGSLRSNGSAVAGSVDLSMSIGSLEVPMTGSFRGRRIGTCR